MPKIVAAFVRAEVRQALAEERPERLGAATASGANEGLELREAELDGIEASTKTPSGQLSKSPLLFILIFRRMEPRPGSA